LKSPNNDLYYLHGNLLQKCKELNLLPSALQYYKNNTVPNTNNNGYGGYRPKSTCSTEKRTNTTGWALYEKHHYDVGGV